MPLGVNIPVWTVFAKNHFIWGSMVALCEVTKVGPTHMSVARRAPLPPAPPQRAYTHVLSGIRARSLDEIFANVVT